LTKTDLTEIYRDYIACLNEQAWPKLEQFVHAEMNYNGRQIGLCGYRGMLENDFYEIPDLHFDIKLLISDPPYIASRLEFDCRPREVSLGSLSTASGFASLRTYSTNFRAERFDEYGR
jgi:predicted ester cyclase